MGRHHDRARALDVDRARRAGRVRARIIRARTGEGRDRAEAKGVRLGRKPGAHPHQQLEAIKRLNAGKETQARLRARTM